MTRRHGPVKPTPPAVATRLAETVSAPGPGAGRGLFGASDVWVTETPSRPARALLATRPDPPRWTLPPAPRTVEGTLKAGDREIRCAVRQVRSGEEDER